MAGELPRGTTCPFCPGNLMREERSDRQVVYICGFPGRWGGCGVRIVITNPATLRRYWRGLDDDAETGAGAT